jgi:hypothetical protein
MSIGSISMKSLSNQLFGGPSTTIDNSAAFTNVTASSFGAETSLAGQAALTRIQAQFTATQAARSGPSTTDGRVATAKATGAAILVSLGLSTGPIAPSAPPSSSSGPYTAPTNPSTGYSYVKTSAGGFASQSTMNLFA